MESDDDIQTIDSDDEFSGISDDNRPLMQLFSRLINGHDNKQSTVLTNSHLIDILHREYNIYQPKKHPLEIDVYLNIMKRFLKDWPLWDEFDKNILDLKIKKDPELSKKALNEKYEDLKSYLKSIVDMAEPKVDNVVKEAISAEKKLYASDVLMEVQCSRIQLNNLFFRKPMPLYKNSIFNIYNAVPTRIVAYYDLKSILNSSGVSVSVYRDSIAYKRTMAHKLKHTLVNKKWNYTMPITKLDMCLEEKEVTKKSLKKVNHKETRNHLKRLRQSVTEGGSQGNNGLYQTVFDLMLEDIKCLPKTIDYPKHYRKIINNYQYIRYFCQDIDSEAESDKYDLQLQEVLTPMLEFYVHRINIDLPDVSNSGGSWITIECLLCQINFSGDNIRGHLEEHFNSTHTEETDWQCTNCQMKISNMELAKKYWYHDCEELPA